ncbi:hypothetical protein M433DRAFT_241225 [Acidomyces richmondensis BFW]|nr:hypothetical protein M433DRAFT_241225 [Acidomyces richmondensis BFW]
MVREDLVEGAVTFLQDPSVASAPLEQRIAFLRSKNLTQEEIDTSLARVGSHLASPPSAQAPPQYQPQYQQQPLQYGYQQPPYWAQPPPEPPKRDWRDWFIMATVLSGIGYGTYWIARRYVYPLIAPPTPPQLEQDKARVDEAFNKAFELLEQLGKDTQELKDAEKSRTERLDAALAEVESVIGRMKEANENREMEAKRMAREMLEIREQIPKAIEKEKSNTDERLKELAFEMKSLKTLLQSRISQPQRAAPTSQATSINGTVNGMAPAVQASDTNGTAAHGKAEDEENSAGSILPDRASNTPTFGRQLGSGGKVAIPAWQMAGKKKNEEAKNDAESAAKREDSSSIVQANASS